MLYLIRSISREW